MNKKMIIIFSLLCSLIGVNAAAMEQTEEMYEPRLDRKRPSNPPRVRRLRRVIWPVRRRQNQEYPFQKPGQNNGVPKIDNRSGNRGNRIRNVYRNLFN